MNPAQIFRKRETFERVMGDKLMSFTWKAEGPPVTRARLVKISIGALQRSGNRKQYAVADSRQTGRRPGFIAHLDGRDCEGVKSCRVDDIAWIVADNSPVAEWTITVGSSINDNPQQSISGGWQAFMRNDIGDAPYRLLTSWLSLQRAIPCFSSISPASARAIFFCSLRNQTVLLRAVR